MAGDLSSFDVIQEYGMKFKVDTEKKRDKSQSFYNENLTLNRGIISSALATYINGKLSVFQPVHCLDAIGGCGVHGILWEKFFGEQAKVTINDSKEVSYRTIQENLQMNELSKTEILNEDPCVLLHKRPFNFIYIDCHTSASHYFDAVFRNLTKNGILAITTSEDSSLYWQSPISALRHYSGVIIKTSYQRELSVRLVIASMIRSAAKYNKGLKILLTVIYKSQQSFTIIVSVQKGSSATSECLYNIKKLLQCSVCEEKVFVPMSDFAVESPSLLLDCQCSDKLPGKTIYELGPLWSGNIFCSNFIENMINDSKNLPWGIEVSSTLNTILGEAQCSGKVQKTFSTKPSIRESSKDQNGFSSAKKSKLENADMNNIEEQVETVIVSNEKKIVFNNIPPFYINLHRHSPKTSHLLKMNKVIEGLKQAGYRASRTHFDQDAVRTDATIRQLQSVCEKLSQQS